MRQRNRLWGISLQDLPRINVDHHPDPRGPPRSEDGKGVSEKRLDELSRAAPDQDVPAFGTLDAGNRFWGRTQELHVQTARDRRERIEKQRRFADDALLSRSADFDFDQMPERRKIGRASCRERVSYSV